MTLNQPTSSLPKASPKPNLEKTDEHLYEDQLDEQRNINEPLNHAGTFAMYNYRRKTETCISYCTKRSVSKDDFGFYISLNQGQKDSDYLNLLENHNAIWEKRFEYHYKCNHFVRVENRTCFRPRGCFNDHNIGINIDEEAVRLNQ